MTISNTVYSVTVTGNSLTTIFSYDFYMGGSANNAVLIFIDSNGNQSEVSSSDFTLTGVTNSAGGTFTYPLSGSAITAGESLMLTRIMPNQQNTAVGNQSNFYPLAVEGALDNLEMQIQQLNPVGNT